MLFIYIFDVCNKKKKEIKMVYRLQKKFSRNQIIVLTSIIVGLITGFEAILLKTIVFNIHNFLQRDWGFSYQEFMIVFFPLIGILITVLIVKFLFKSKLGRGISNILFEIAKKASFVQKDKMFSHVLTSAITVGFGGSAGLEAPIVVTGSAVGSNVGRAMKFSYKERTLMLASGAAAGIAAVFNAPITGVLFAIEVLLVEATVKEFIPIIISAVAGALCSKIVLGEDILFIFKLREAFNYHNVPYYILLGIFSGFIALYYAKMTHYIDSIFSKFKKHIYAKAFVGGTVLALMILLFPSLFGEGYQSIKLMASGNSSEIFHNSIVSNLLSNEWFFIIFVGLLALIKVIATSVTLGSGGNGGNFAPSLFVGAYFGFFFSRLINKLQIASLPESNFILVGMAGILSGVFYAPFTGIFLIAEITGGYELIIPLMIVSAFSFLICKHFEPYSMDNKKLAEKGRILTDDKDSNVLTLLKTSRIIEDDILIIEVRQHLGDLVELIKKSHRNIYAVVNISGQLVGIIELDDVREIMFKPELYHIVTVKHLMKNPKAVIHADEDMKNVMRKFDYSNSWNLPIIDEDGLYIGFVSKANIFNNYRKLLKGM